MDPAIHLFIMRTTKAFLLSIIAGLTLSACAAICQAGSADPFEVMPAARINDIPASRPTLTRAFIDEIEDDDARVLLDNDSHVYTMPLDILPEGTHEGSIVWISISR
jgi:hypothetical protein